MPIHGPTLIAVFDQHDDPLEALFVDIEHLREGMFDSLRGGGPEGRDVPIPDNVRLQTRDIVRRLALVATLDQVPPEWVALAVHLIDALPAFGELWQHALAAIFEASWRLPPDGTDALGAIRNRLKSSVDAPPTIFNADNDTALLVVLGELYDVPERRWRVAREGERSSKALWTPWGAMRKLAGAIGISVQEKAEAKRDHKAERADVPTK